MPEPLEPIASQPKNIINEIYSGSLSEQEKQRIYEIGKFYDGEGDPLAFDEVQALRNEIGSIEGWKAAKEKARQELAEVPDDVLEKLLERFAPLIKNLPPGHSRGHFLRDSAYLTSIFQDLDVQNYDAVEVLVGMLGGMYHDIGNSVIGRYDEPRRFSGHAEVGAHLFGLMAKDVLGENLVKMTQLAISAHTHYTKDRTVVKNGETRTMAPYDDEVVDGNRMAFWWTRQSDRNDAQGPIMDVRHFITKAEPTEDFDGKEFHATWENPDDDFRHQFTPVMRTPEERATKEKPENAPNVLEHVTMFARSNFNPALPYAKHDNLTLQTRITAAAEEQHEFVTDVVSETPVISKEQRNEAFEKFFQLCQIVEPSEGTPGVIEKFRRKFQLLDEKQQSHWANGFRSLTERLYPRMWQRMNGILEDKPQEIKDIDQAGTKVQTVISDHLHPVAREIWRNFELKM